MGFKPGTASGYTAKTTGGPVTDPRDTPVKGGRSKGSYHKASGGRNSRRGGR
jgi:hypothetical protein